MERTLSIFFVQRAIGERDCEFKLDILLLAHANDFKLLNKFFELFQQNQSSS